MNFFFKFLLNAIPRPWLLRASLYFQKLIGLLLKGDQFTDPINGQSYRLFLPYGYARMRKNALSPGTLSLERHRLFWLFLEKETTFFQERSKVLHMAPEQCFLNRFKSLENIEYITADLYSPLADVKADITQLPFPDHSFDIVFCNHVLEHIPDDRKAMSELYRVMKPGGWGVFQVPMDTLKAETYEDFSISSPKERAKHFGQYDHVRVYGRDYYKRLESVGFQVELKQPGLNLTKEEAERFSVVRQEEIPMVRK